MSYTWFYSEMKLCNLFKSFITKMCNLLKNFHLINLLFKYALIFQFIFPELSRKNANIASNKTCVINTLIRK